uniref:Conserved hypothetcial protein n=1 Tax=Melanopsichium pennsylvanicum 4 TaxID=1398559 RepID=A0A077REA8_9BASI|nr:conserved hypothetcial protein [Melanopsichium pennsylvanicum 4]
MATSKTSALLQGKKVVVIGGSSGIGFSAASAFIEEGATVIIGSSSQSRVDSAIQRLSDPNIQYNADPSRISGHTVNLKGSNAETSLKEFFSKVGTFDHLIYTAGDSLVTKPLSEWNYQDIVDVGSVRFTSAILAVKVATSDSNLLKQNGSSSIVLTTGIVGVKPSSGWSVVAGYAAGLYGLTRNLALDLSDKGIRVNAVAPGAVETELWHAFPEETRKQVLQSRGDKLLTGRVGQPEDLANVYIYLTKDKNITAQIIVSDGGDSTVERS